MMKFVVNTDEDMLIKVTDSTSQISSFNTATVTYDIYYDNKPLVSGNAVVQNAAPRSVVGQLFRCSVAPLVGWGAGRFALFLNITNIPGRPETPRLGPFRFEVIA